jgi:hypothetical protein
MEWNVPNEADTKFRLASVTKQFTAALILQLVEQGKLKLDGKALRVSARLSQGRGRQSDHPSSPDAHLRHPQLHGLPKFMEDASRNPYAVADFRQKYASGDLEFEPGAKFRYNNPAISARRDHRKNSRQALRAGDQGEHLRARSA